MATDARWKSNKKRLRPGDNLEAQYPAKDAEPPEKNSLVSLVPNTQQLLTLFSNCMSALSTNKICSRNAFEVGIIDHMSDMVYLEDEEEVDDNVASDLKNANLNFTRASKVVEGASKIYGYRIEAVYDQTLNVLMNMNSATSTEPTQETKGVKRQRNIKRVELVDGTSTLATAADVTLTKLPADVAMLDPYFCKVSSMFDQSGAEGLLLTNLLVSDELTINLDGDGLVFEGPLSPRSSKTGAGLNLQKLDSLITAHYKDLKKIEILPEAAYFRNELQRILGRKKRKDKEADAADVKVDWTTTTTTTTVEPDAKCTNDLTPEEPSRALDSVPYDGYAGMGLDDFTGGPGDVGDDTGMNFAAPTLATSIVPPLMQRLEMLDVKGGSQFNYFKHSGRPDSLFRLTPAAISNFGRTDSTDASAATTPLQPQSSAESGLQIPLGQKRLQQQQQQGMARMVKLQDILQHNAQDEIATIELVPTISGRRVCSPAPPSEAAGLIFQFSDAILCRFGTLSNRTIALGTYNWKSMADESLHQFDDYCAFVQVKAADDYEAPYTTVAVADIFSFDAGANIMEGALAEEGTNVEDIVMPNTGWNNDAMNTDVPFNDIMGMPAAIEGSVTDTSFFNPISKDVAEAAAANLNKKASNEPIPPTVGNYVDVFKIKTSLCSVILPPPDFEDAIEEELPPQQLQAMTNGTVQTGDASPQSPKSPTPTEIKITFQNAIAETVSRLDGKEREALNVHMLLVCLLHVCNEHNLLLKQVEPLADFNIIANAIPQQHYNAPKVMLDSSVNGSLPPPVQATKKKK